MKEAGLIRITVVLHNAHLNFEIVWFQKQRTVVDFLNCSSKDWGIYVSLLAHMYYI